DRLGIPSYVLSESCRQGETSDRGTMDPIQALYTDVENLGTIFNVPDRADALVERYKQTIADAQDTVVEDGEDPDVFLYDSGTDQPFTVGTNAAASAVIENAGGRNIFDDIDDSWTTVTFEAAANRDPDVILIVDYGQGPNSTVEAKKNFL